jgi:hypothetical protein
MLFLIFIKPNSPYSSYSPLGPRALSVSNILIIGYIIINIIIIIILIKFNII